MLTIRSNGVPAEQVQAQLGLGSCKTAWLLLQRLRRAMVDTDRRLLERIADVNETELPVVLLVLNSDFKPLRSFSDE